MEAVSGAVWRWDGAVMGAAHGLEVRLRDLPDLLVSIVVPMLNESENVEPLWRELVEVSAAWPFRAEFIFVDDGSSDGTGQLLREVAAGDGRVVVIQLAKRFGQSAALLAGFREARGHVVVPMDGDMQNNPRDIPAMVAALDEPPGFDVVSGWRRRRQDAFWLRRLPSILANKLIGRLTWTPLHDFGCTLKAYRKEILEELLLYGEMHRFLPAICKWQGGRVTERVVDHRPRERGTSKYGLKRTIKVLLDLLTVKFLGDYLSKPIYFFGKLSLLSLACSGLLMAIAICQKFGILYPEPGGLNLNRNILAHFSFTLLVVAIMMLMMGVLSELMVRIYYESQGKPPYRVRRTLRGGEGSAGASAASEVVHGGHAPIQSIPQEQDA